MKKVQTKHALLMSMTSLLICVSMLLGATFAWFTDSVTSGVNHIVAGNLDVELYHSTTSTTAAAPGDSVDGATELFVTPAEGSNILWEPGAMAYETFTVKNVGSLALKYKMALTQSGYNTVVENYSTPTERSLLHVIKVAEIESPAGFDRATLAAAFNASTPTLGEYITSGATDATTNTLLAGTNKTFTLVLYWPSDTEGISTPTTLKDNDYNLQNGKTSSDGNPLWVDLGVTLVAGQLDYEVDVFDKTYDETAPYAAIALTNTINTSAAATVTAGTGVKLTSADNKASVTIPDAAAEDGNYMMTVEPTPDDPTITIAAGNEATFFDVDLKKDGVAAGTLTGDDYYVAELNIGPNLDMQFVYHNGVQMGTSAGSGEYYEYNATTGILKLYVYSFSPFAAEYTAPLFAIGNVPYYSAAAAIAAVKNGETITLVRNGSGDIAANVDKTYTINFNGYAYVGSVSVTAGKVTLANAKLTGSVSGDASKVTTVSGTYGSDVTDYLMEGYLVVPNAETNPTAWTIKSEATIAASYAEAAGATAIEESGSGAIGTMDDGVIYKWYADETVFIQDASGFNGKNGSGEDDPTYYIVGGLVEVDGILETAFLNSNVSKVKFTSNLESAWKGFCGSSNAEPNTKLTEVIFDGMTVIPARLLCNCTALTTITIPNTVTAIGEGAFRQSGLTSVTIPASVQTIAKEMVAYCPNITTVTFEGSPAINQYYIGRASASLTDVYFNGNPTFTAAKSITFSHTEGGIASGITVHFANETTKNAFEAANASTQMTYNVSDGTK